MTQETECEYCRWVEGHYNKESQQVIYKCRLNRVMNLVWCSSFEREPGSDDDK